MIRLKKRGERLSKSAVFLHILVLLSFFGLVGRGPLVGLSEVVAEFSFRMLGFPDSIVFAFYVICLLLLLHILFFILSLLLNMKTIWKFLTSFFR